MGQNEKRPAISVNVAAPEPGVWSGRTVGDAASTAASRTTGFHGAARARPASPKMLPPASVIDLGPKPCAISPRAPVPPNQTSDERGAGAGSGFSGDEGG